VFRAPPSQMTSGHKLDVNLTIDRYIQRQKGRRG